MAKKETVPVRKAPEAKRTYISQAEVPAHSLIQALKVPQAIADNYGKNPTKPLRVAEAMGLTPSSGHFRMLCGAAIAYGLTDGGYNSETIAITALGRRIVVPTREGDDLAAKKEALLRPRVVRDFLTRYNESRLPIPQIARNVLEEMGVPADRGEEVFNLIVEGARALGMIVDLKGQGYVDLGKLSEPGADEGKPSVEEAAPAEREDVTQREPLVSNPGSAAQLKTRSTGRVFITHGRNKEIVAQLKDLLSFGGFTPVVAIEQETVSKPVPDKVLDEMRTCAAAIIHVGTDMKLMDQEGKEHKMLNQNVLIEIGAAMALYGRKFILLVEKGTGLPSNLLGLYEVRYEGDKLDYDATMKLLKAFADFRG
jgi:predicted nucleotide-binding protein